MRGFAGIAASLLLVALAGCTGSASGDGGGPDEPVGGVDVTVTDSTGAIRGVVVDQAIVPIEGVSVRVANTELEATTNAEGGFGFSRVEPGLYFLEVSKAGYGSTQLSAEVEAGVAEPPVLRVQLVEDLDYNPYYAILVFEGFIECTTRALVLCGAPNTLEPFACELGVCYGNVTNDHFTWTQYYAPGASLVQSEMAWESTQAASPDLYFEQEALTEGCPNTDLSTVLNSTMGASPIYTQIWPSTLEQYEISETCGIFHSVFSGEVVPGSFTGVTLEQTFTMYTHSFYGFTPPPGWRFTVDGDPPVPS